MSRKTILIMDSSTFRNSNNEQIRIESTFGSFRNEHLASYSESLEWIIGGSKDILSTVPHGFFRITPTADDAELARAKGIGLGIAVLSTIQSKIKTAIQKDIDLVIYNTGDSKDWVDYNNMLNSADADAQKNIRNKTILVDSICCNYSIIIPKIIKLLGINPSNKTV